MLSDSSIGALEKPWKYEVLLICYVVHPHQVQLSHRDPTQKSGFAGSSNYSVDFSLSLTL